MTTSTQQAVTSAENAATDSLDRYLDEVCTEQVEEIPLFDLVMVEKTFDVLLNQLPSTFKPFNRKHRPKDAGCIMELKKKERYVNQYTIVVRPNATSQTIQMALETLVEPL